MAGIGFSLRKMLKDESTYSTRVYAWFHTAVVSAGPWIISILTINIVLAFSERWDIPFAERELLIAAIIYSTLFSQLLTAPFQMIITRYIADRIYDEELAYIKPSFWGISLLISIISLIFGIWFYHDKDLPIEFLYLAVMLMVVLSVLWILIVYQSTLKNFKLITMSNLLGTFVTFILILYFTNNPLHFSRFSGTINLLLAYSGGILVFMLFLLIGFLTEMKEDNGKIFHFVRYFNSVPSLWPIGFLYTAAIWVDNLIMWFSPISVNLFGIFRYAPFYDVASFYSYLTILPAVMLFMVLIETDFYIKCREFYLAVLRNGPLSELQVFADRMWTSLQQNILQTFEIQLFVTILIIVLSKSLFPLLGVPEESRQIFVIYALGAFCNAFILIFLQVLLYIGERNRTLLLMVVFFVSNCVFTLFSLVLGEQFYGFGFFLSSFITLLLGFYLIVISYKRVIRHTYMMQPVYTRSHEKTFEKLEVWLDKRQSDRDALDKLYLEKRKKKHDLKRETPPQVEAAFQQGMNIGIQDQQQREAEKDYKFLSSPDNATDKEDIPPEKDGKSFAERAVDELYDKEQAVQTFTGFVVKEDVKEINKEGVEEDSLEKILAAYLQREIDDSEESHEAAPLNILPDKKSP